VAEAWGDDAMPEAELDFQEFVSHWVSKRRAAGAEHSQNDDDSDDDDLQTRLFELANAPAVTYRCQGGQHITVRQYRTAKVHTGGIVWETAFLLALFLEQQQQQRRQQQQQKRQQAAASSSVGARHVLEVGAGCGLLGMVLAAAGCDVVLSEHPIALANLQSNVAACEPLAERARVVQLDWTKETHIQALVAAQRARGCPPCFDTIVGTDVVFSEQLVAPLLHTIHTLAHAKTTVWLCLQERCAASHKQLLASIPSYFGSCAQIRSPSEAVEEGCDEDVAAVIEALHGELECVLLKLTGRLEVNADMAGSQAGCSERQAPAMREDQPSRSTPTATETQAQEQAPVAARGATTKESKRNRDMDQADPRGDRAPRKKHKKSKKSKNN
jgi:hypothetical protein